MRLSRTHSLPLLLCACLAFAELGCVRIGSCKTAPERHFYVLDVVRSAGLEQRSGRYTLETSPGVETPGAARPLPFLAVRPFSVAHSYASRGFVYRTQDRELRTDYYNLFFVDPGSVLTDQSREWLSDSGLFAGVLTPGSRLNAGWILEGDVPALYGDYRDPERPCGAMEIRFTLIDESKTSPTLVLSRDYTQSVPCDTSSPDALVSGWNEALRRILARFEDDLGELAR